MRVLYAIGSLFLCLLVGACANSGNSISSVLSIIPPLGDAFNYARFQPAKLSGIKKGQKINLYAIPKEFEKFKTLDQANSFRETVSYKETMGLESAKPVKLSQDGLSHFNATLEIKSKNEYNRVRRLIPEADRLTYDNNCKPKAKKTSQTQALTPSFLTLGIGTIAGKLIEGFTDQLEDKAKQIQEDSTATYSTRIVAKRSVFDWTNLKCLAFIRETSPSSLPAGESTTGLIVIIKRDEQGKAASTFYPIYVRMNNSKALTGDAEKPKLKLQLAFTLHVIEFNKKNQRSELRLVEPALTFPGIGVVLGKSHYPCAEAPQSIKACSLETLPIPNPDNPSAISLGVAVTEVGTGANQVQKSQASINALKELLNKGLSAVVN